MNSGIWEEKLRQVVQKKALYGEKVNGGATEKDIQALNKSLADETKVNLPDEYIKILYKINGIEFNGFILYGVDEELLDESPNQHVNGILENNKMWYENEWQRQYLFVGESNISWYVYDLTTKKYYELDNPSGSVCEEFSSFEYLLEKFLDDSLM